MLSIRVYLHCVNSNWQKNNKFIFVVVYPENAYCYTCYFSCLWRATATLILHILSVMFYSTTSKWKRRTMHLEPDQINLTWNKLIPIRSLSFKIWTVRNGDLFYCSIAGWSIWILVQNRLNLSDAQPWLKNKLVDIYIKLN